MASYTHPTYLKGGRKIEKRNSRSWSHHSWDGTLMIIELGVIRLWWWLKGVIFIVLTCLIWSWKCWSLLDFVLMALFILINVWNLIQISSKDILFFYDKAWFVFGCWLRCSSIDSTSITDIINNYRKNDVQCNKKKKRGFWSYRSF